MGFTLAMACGGKSESGREPSTGHLDASAGESTAGSTSASGASGGGGGSAGSSGASNAASAGSSGTAGSDPMNSPACSAYNAASLLDACNQLAPCAATLPEYLDLLRMRGWDDEAEVRVGCKHVSIALHSSDTPKTELTFEQDGALAGYSSFVPEDSSPCGAYQYVRGAGIDSSCIPVRQCRIAADAHDTATLCSCPCPEPARSDGVAVVPEACVVTNLPVPACSPTSEEEHRAMTGLDFGGPHWENECGVEVAYLPGDTRCYYGADGVLLGIRHEDSTQCAGVDEWVTSGVPPVCHP